MQIGVYVDVQGYDTAGVDQVFVTCADTNSGMTYAFCYSYGSPYEFENGNFIMATTISPDVINVTYYNATLAIPAANVRAATVLRNGTLLFAGSAGNGTILCAFISYSVSCFELSSNNGDDVVALLEDPTGQIWVIGTTTGSFANYSNLGGKDIFAIVIFPNNNTKTFLQWGTNQDDVPSSATFHEEMQKLFVGGYSLGNFSGPSSTYDKTGFVTEILFEEIKLGSGTVQWSTDGSITGMSVDPVSNALLLFGSLDASRKRASASGFVASYSLSSTGTIIPSTLYVLTFGNTGEKITSFAYNSVEGSILAAGYQVQVDGSLVGIYYQIVGGVVPAVVIGDDYAPQTILFNSFEGTTQIFGTSGYGNLTSLFVYSLLPGGPVTISSPQPPSFGEITTTSIEIYWLTPLARSYNYTLLFFNSTNIFELQTDFPTHHNLTNLTTNTYYTFALKLSGNFSGSPLLSANSSIYTIDECAGKPIRCQNGTCVPSLYDCAVNKTICPSNRPYLCSLGSCVESYLECANDNTSCVTGALCWNGACVASTSLCDPVPSCPALKRRCPDGRCAALNETCSNTTLCSQKSLCPDGSCPPCGSTYGCPLAVPILCPNGSCVANESICREGCNETGYLCYDGSCQENYLLCSKPPRLNYPLPFSYTFPRVTVGDTLTNITIPILSDFLSQIASINVPPSIFSLRPSSLPGDPPFTISISPVPDSDMYDVGFGVWENFTYGASLYSAVISLTFNGPNKFRDLVKISFNNDVPKSQNQSNICLAFINRTADAWNLVDQIRAENGTLSGYTTHFTEFAVMFGVKPPNVNVIDGSDFEKLTEINKNTVGVYVVAGVLFVYLVSIFFTIRHDRQKRVRNSIHASLASPLQQPKPVAMTTFSVSPSDDAITENTDNTQTDTNSPRKGTTSIDVPTIIRTEDGKLKDEKGNVVGWKDLYVRRFPEKHSWLAVYFSPPKRRHLTHTDLLTLLFCMIWANLMVSSLLFTPTDPYSIGQKIVNGICVACIVFPITIIFSLMFHKMPLRFKWISYALAIAFYLVCAILTLIETLKFGNEDTKTWLISISVSTVQDGMINQPIKLVIICLVIILYPAAPLIALLL